MKSERAETVRVVGYGCESESLAIVKGKGKLFGVEGKVGEIDGVSE